MSLACHVARADADAAADAERDGILRDVTDCRYLTGSEPDLDPLLASLGMEFRLPVKRYAVRLTPVAGIDVNSLEARDWDLTASVVAGIEMSNADGTHRYRLLLTYLRGFIPFGQFFDTQRLENYGLLLQFDF